MYASLDTCAVVPIGAIRVKHHDAELEPMEGFPSACTLNLNEGGFDEFVIGEVDEPSFEVYLPEGDGVTVDELVGGTVIHLDNRDRRHCHSLVLADNGVFLRIRPTKDMSSDPPDPPACATSQELARNAAERLGKGVPVVDWPARSLHRKDVCAVMEDTQFAAGLGLDVEVTTNASHLNCSYLIDTPKHGPVIGITAFVGGTSEQEWDLSEGSELRHEVISVAGHRTDMLDDQPDPDDPRDDGTLCRFEIDFGANRELQRRFEHVDHESLMVQVVATGPYDCESVLPSVSELVATLG